MSLTIIEKNVWINFINCSRSPGLYLPGIIYDRNSWHKLLISLCWKLFSLIASPSLTCLLPPSHASSLPLMPPPLQHLLPTSASFAQVWQHISGLLSKPELKSLKVYRVCFGGCNTRVNNEYNNRIYLDSFYLILFNNLIPYYAFLITLFFCVS